MRRLLLQLAGLALVAVALAVVPATASATHVDHAFEFSFDGSEAHPPKPFRYPVAVDVDSSGGPSNGDLYVGEIYEGGPEGLGAGAFKFDEEGHYQGVYLHGEETPAGSLSFTSDPDGIISLDGIAVDSSSGPTAGDVYVVDPAREVVERFDENGHYLCQITGKAIPSPSECNGLSGSHIPEARFTPAGLAVDPTTGRLYVANAVGNAVDEFSASGAYLGEITGPHVSFPTELALDSTGALYVSSGGIFQNGKVVKFDSAGSFKYVLDENHPLNIAVDALTDEVYVMHGQETEIAVYGSTGALEEHFELPPAIFRYALGVSPESGRLYVGNTDVSNGVGVGNVSALSPDAQVPTVTTANATAVEETLATLHGTATPDPAEILDCRFEYGLTTEYRRVAPCAPSPPYAGGTAASTNLAGLEASTTYHYRLAAGNAPTPPRTRPVRGYGADMTFTTVGHPTIEGESAEVERTFATLHATIDPHGFDTEFKFEYVDAAHFASEGFASSATKSTAISQLGGGVKPLAVNQTVAGLSINATYHYRVYATNARGTRVGVGGTFITRPVAAIVREWAYAHLTNARVEARIDPLGLDTTCQVQYVETARFKATGYAEAETAPCVAGLGAGNGVVVGRAALNDLRFDTGYHFRFVVTNSTGTEVGADETFSTFGIETFSIKVIDKQGHPYTQAGGHPYEKIIHYGFNHTVVPRQQGNTINLDAFLRNVITEQPPGQSGVQEEETKKCPTRLAEENNCSSESQVGELEIEYVENGVGINKKPLYNVVAPDGVATRYATLNPYSPSDTSVRSGSDYGTTSNGRYISEEGKAIGATIHIWGVPSEHLAHANPSAILRNPTACAGPQTATLKADSWSDPNHYAVATFQLPATTGCDKLEFHPTVEWQPTSHVADTPTGLHVDIHQALSVKPDELAYADLKDVVIDPGKGLVFNPAGAGGLKGCTEAQAAIHREGPSSCPASSKIGTMEIDTPLVDHPLLGGIYMAAPHDNEFDSEFAIYLIVDDPRTGVAVKLAGEIQADHENAQLGASFSENPQLPVEDFKLDFFGGPRSVLRTPAGCGTYVTHATLTPWSAPDSGPPAQSGDSFQITSGPDGVPCTNDEGSAPNRPRFRAGSTDASAGSSAPYFVRFERDDGTQQMAHLSIAPPEGLLAHLAGIPRCAPAAAAAALGRTGTQEAADPSCPASSKVGSVTVAAGAGAEPYYVNGSVYLSGPYAGAPVSLAVIVPVLAGPFDLGTVVVRTPLLIDLESAAVGIDTDPLPTILEGVSLDVRSIEVRLDRPGFTVNPTDCAPSQTTAAVRSLASQSALLSDPFQVVDCNRLGFKPKLAMRLRGKPRRRVHPTLQAVLTMPPRSASIDRVTVAMPPTEFLDSGNVGEICTRSQFVANACPPDSVYGHVAAWTPLLERPLAGPVYLRSANKGFPELVADLDGEFRVAVAGRIEPADGGIGAAIKGLPDVPLSKFTLTINGGPKGLLQNSQDPCLHPGRATIRLEGHNGKVAVLRPPLRANCHGRH